MIPNFYYSFGWVEKKSHVWNYNYIIYTFYLIIFLDLFNMHVLYYKEYFYNELETQNSSKN